jgi:PAS domain S-box-containing protein
MALDQKPHRTPTPRPLANSTPLAPGTAAGVDLGAKLPAVIFANISDGLVIVDNNWQYAYVNAEAERLIGSPFSSLRSASLWENFFDIQGTAAEEKLRRVATDRTASQFECYRKETRLWLSCAVYPLDDDGVGIYLRDISQRKRTQRYLDLAQSIPRILAASSTLALAANKLIESLCIALEWDWGAVWSIDDETQTIHCIETWHVPTHSFSEFTTTTRQMTFSKGMGLPGQVWENASTVWISNLTDSALVRRPSATKEGLRSAFGFPIASTDRIRGVMEFFSKETREPQEELRNLTEAIGSEVNQFIERKWVERELAHQTYLLKTVTDNATSMLYMIDSADKATYVNPAVEQIIGYSAAELIGEVMHDKIHHTHPDGTPFPIDECPLSRAIEASGGRVRDYEDVFVRKDGTFFPVRCSASTIFRDGVRLGTVIDAQDITTAKRAESELQRLNLELETRITERTAELRDAQIALLRDLEKRTQLEAQLLQSQKLEGLGTLAGGVAHEFNNILNVINSHISLLPSEDIAPQSARDIDAIKQMVGRGASLVRQLLSVSRKAEIKLSRVQVNRVVENLELFLKQIFPKTISIAFELDPNLPVLMADENQISQALLNLCLNARDAMPDGGELTITSGTISAEEIQRLVPGVTEKPYIVLKVKDTGDGIDPDIQNRIFEPFFTTKPPGQGTGLGLSVVHGIAVNHGGFVDVKSGLGAGAIFSVYFPLSDEPVPYQSSNQQWIVGAVGRGDTILFVEDEIYQLELMSRFLERQGYQVLTAADGELAVEIYSRNREAIALVILDLGLPKLNGWEAFKRMKESDPGLKAILTTGYIPDTIPVQPSEFCKVIMKPYTPNDLLVEILRVLNVV